LSSYASGRAAPGAETLIAISTLTKKSIDWILKSEEPPLPQLVTQMLDAIDKARKEGLIPASDPQITEYMEAITGLTPEQRKIIIDLALQLKQSR